MLLARKWLLVTIYLKLEAGKSYQPSNTLSFKLVITFLIIFEFSHFLYINKIYVLLNGQTITALWMEICKL
jgi:hypothetical protein